MSATRYIQRFNDFNGKKVTKGELVNFLHEVKQQASVQLAIVEQRLENAISKLNGHAVILQVDPVIVAKKKPFKKNGRKVKAKRKPVKRIATKKVVRESAPKAKKVKIDVPKIEPGLYGITTADSDIKQSTGRIQLPLTVGEFIGRVQPYKLVIVIAGETHSGKSEIGKQVANSLMELGYPVLWADWEQGGLEAEDTLESIARNIDAKNKSKFHVSGDIPKNIQALKNLAKQYPVIALDSGRSLNQKNNDWIEELRTDCPNTIWIILMQQNAQGDTKGGSSAEFDAPVVIKTYRPDIQDHNRNYAELFKCRGNKTGKYYNISSKQILSTS